MAENPISILSRLFRGGKYSALVEETLLRSVLSPQDYRWRTETQNGTIRIYGNSASTVASLGALAHELGHAIFEQSAAVEDPLSFQVHSEACAMTLEWWVINEILPAHHRPAWAQYQAQNDELNSAYYELEFSPASSRIQPSHLIPLRETFYTAFGYQAVYWLASLERAKILRVNPKTGEILIDAAMATHADWHHIGFH